MRRGAVWMAVFATFMPTPAPAQDGVLLMVHGGDEAWNQKVENAAELVRQHYPTENRIWDGRYCVAGRGSRKAGGARSAAGCSGSVVYQRRILSRAHGVHSWAAEKPRPNAARQKHDSWPFYAAFAHRFNNAVPRLSKAGLLNCAEIGQILKSQAAALSKEPSKETVLILAHGTGDDAENGLWLAAMRRQASVVKQLGRFRAIHCRTVREDWPEKRGNAVAEIRHLAEQAQADGGRCLVIPYRLAGFGGYAEVLKGLSYEADKTGFVPHPLIDEWILRTARELLTDGAETPSDPRSGRVAPWRG